MERVDPSEWLSAADCASRTGLTVRALRVYEELGLIAPRRSAGGWRQYGPHDLVKLNTIVLLKTGGLSLEQIREVTRSRANEPGLRQVLAIHLETWKRKRMDAERGQAIAEAALARLGTGQSLSVDELCNLIRGLEVSHSQAAGSPPYEEMSSQLEQVIRLQLPALQLLAEPLGAIRSIEFRGVGSGGWDQYDVHRERGTSRWQILMATDAKIASVSFEWDRPASERSGVSQMSASS
jgi:DNA-binding transcriptional MerR regulator